MENEILAILSAYGAEVIVIGLLINLLTQIAKIPIKAYSKKSGKNINRYITLLPVIFGFTGAFVYKWATVGFAGIKIEELFTLAVSSASLSLALFAIFEKFFQRKKDGEEKKASEEMIADAQKIGALLETLNGADGKALSIQNGDESRADGNDAGMDITADVAGTETQTTESGDTAPEPRLTKRIILGHKRNDDEA